MSRPSEKVIPQPKASRPAVGVRARSAATPLRPAALASAKVIALSETDAGTLAGVIAALPDPAALAPGTLVVLRGDPAGGRSLAQSVLAVFGRTKPIPRTRRCTALVARGYVEVGAAESDDGDLAWGQAPPPSPGPA